MAILPSSALKFLGSGTSYPATELRMLELSQLTRNPDATVIIVIPGYGSIVSWIEEGLSFSGGNEYSEPLSGAAQKTFSETVSTGISISNSLLNKNIAQVQLKNIDQTIYSWTGSIRPSFTLPLTFVSTDDRYDCRPQIAVLLQCVYPSGQTLLKIPGTSKSLKVMRAPLSYSASRNSAQGTVTLKIGSWFSAPNLIVRKVDSIKFSKEIIKPDGELIGRPLYATASITLEPYRMPLASQMAGYMGVSL